MNDINTFYYNDFGIAFQWKRCAAKDFRKVQLVFRNTGLLLSLKELIKFLKNIDKSLNFTSKYENCKPCKVCQSILLEAPNSQISFAMSYHELRSLKDLIKGTLFQLALDNLLKEKEVNYIRTIK